MRISADWIGDRPLQQVLACLAGAGYRALLVGGCVRNALLDEPVGDIDIATDALPGEVARLAANAGLKVVPTGVDHGTVTVIAAGRPHEITTFRRDVATDGRRAVVAFSHDIAEDAARRDFTMNALYADKDGTVIDPLGGLADLAARRVRFVGHPEDRIREDYLRILRFFRFQAAYGDAVLGLDAEGLAACAAHAEGLDALSRERIGHEMRKLLAARDPAAAVAAMRAAGILGRALPGADDRALGPLVHLEGDELPPDALRRLAVLGGEDPVSALRLSRAEGRHLAVLRAGIESTMGAGEAAYRFGAAAGRDIVLLRAALTETGPPAGWQAAVEAGAQARFPVRAADIADGHSGRALGLRLKLLEERWIASGFTLSREQLLA